jgi:cytochrome c oxidase assembly protein subunit 11
MHFASDNAGPVHPGVMEALAAANQGHAPAYGGDDLSARSVARIREVFEAPRAEVFLVASGTAANGILLASLAQPWATVFAAETAHIHEDECGATEFMSGGSKITLVGGEHGKLDAGALAETITGLGGRTGGQYTYDPADMQRDASRLVKVNFITNTNGGMPWKFWSESGGVRIHPGEVKQVNFYVTNPTDRPMVGQAVPSVVPPKAAEFFHKTECFCFNSQVLEPGETMEMPMRFIVDPNLPDNVQSISLSYALFDISDFAAADEVQRVPQS